VAWADQPSIPRSVPRTPPEVEAQVLQLRRELRDWCARERYVAAVEYVEPGASATDDKRSAFQQMIGEACGTPPPFGAIVVHPQSRFFRDLYGFLAYERRLQRAGVRLVSITEATSEDASGQMFRHVFSIFDQYQSEDNAKHTLRSRKENARRG
jgi:site-specific DNA recombinase